MVTDDLATIFSDVAQELEPDLAAMIDKAIRRGRRIKARRRIAIALSAGATVLTVAVATTVGARAGGLAGPGAEAGVSRRAPAPPNLRSRSRTTCRRSRGSRKSTVRE